LLQRYGARWLPPSEILQLNFQELDIVWGMKGSHKTMGLNLCVHGLDLSISRRSMCLTERVFA
jgi:hypothetical protein